MPYVCDKCGCSIAGDRFSPATFVFELIRSKPYYGCVYCERSLRNNADEFIFRGQSCTKASPLYLRSLSDGQLCAEAHRLGLALRLTKRSELVDFISSNGHDVHKKSASVIGHAQRAYALCRRCATGEEDDAEDEQTEEQKEQKETTDSIRRIAYGFWELDGRPSGQDWKHWFEAEHRLSQVPPQAV
jgi:hypothetical protein